MKFQEFRGLSAEAKNMEILNMLPLLTPLTKEFSNLKNSLSHAIDKVENDDMNILPQTVPTFFKDKLFGVWIWNLGQQDPQCGWHSE